MLVHTWDPSTNKLILEIMLWAPAVACLLILVLPLSLSVELVYKGRAQEFSGDVTVQLERYLHGHVKHTHYVAIFDGKSEEGVLKYYSLDCGIMRCYVNNEQSFLVFPRTLETFVHELQVFLVKTTKMSTKSGVRDEKIIPLTRVAALTNNAVILRKRKKKIGVEMARVLSVVYDKYSAYISSGDVDLRNKHIISVIGGPKTSIAKRDTKSLRPCYNELVDNDFILYNKHLVYRPHEFINVTNISGGNKSNSKKEPLTFTKVLRVVYQQDRSHEFYFGDATKENRVGVYYMNIRPAVAHQMDVGNLFLYLDFTELGHQDENKNKIFQLVPTTDTAVELGLKVLDQLTVHQTLYSQLCKELNAGRKRFKEYPDVNPAGMVSVYRQYGDFVDLWIPFYDPVERETIREVDDLLRCEFRSGIARWFTTEDQYSTRRISRARLFRSLHDM
eukprot:Lankesteria_metandrocarpae@DN1491_c0_g1_i1.p1